MWSSPLTAIDSRSHPRIGGDSQGKYFYVFTKWLSEGKPVKPDADLLWMRETSPGALCMIVPPGPYVAFDTPSTPQEGPLNA